MSNNGRPPRMHVVSPDATQPGDFGEEPTEPGVDVVVSNRVLYRLIQGLSRRITALAVAVLVLAGAVAMFGLLLWWSRPG